MDFIYLYFFIIGSILGSFYNVVGLRVPEKKSIVAPRSACPNCKHQLAVTELFPVLSFLLQKGKCRNCGCKISLIYPLFELCTGILFVFSIVRIGLTKELIVSLTLISLLMIITVSDITYMIIPDRVLLFFTPLVVVERILFPLHPWWNSLLGFVVGFSLLLLIAIVSRGGMGGGDIKLFAVLGIVLGWKLVLLAFFFSTFFGALFGVIGMLFKKVERGKPMPFGPYIALGALVSYFLGENLINWYSMSFLTLL